MGTRNLTSVIQSKKVKIAQYGQWDGYPEGQGLTVLDFLKKKGNIDKLKKKLKIVRFLKPNGRDKKFSEEYDKNAPEWSSEPDKRTPEQLKWFKSYITRDLGADILNAIISSSDKEIVLRDEWAFRKDDLFCEWHYCIDLDKKTLTVNNLKTYKLDKLPTKKKFLKDFEENED